MKDNFSTQSDKYALYRPSYPKEFFVYLNNMFQNKEHAWDCGTGNGQIASELCKTFQQVYATDISQSQLDHAFVAENIVYSLQPAEKTNFQDHFFNLIIVAQAVHWFNFDLFYAEVKRTAKKNALLCIVGYGKLEISEEIDPIITDFYHNIIGKYWDAERTYVDLNYTTIPFPFKEIETPKFVNIQNWTLGQCLGYLNTWSAVKHFIKENGYNPIEQLKPKLEKFWQEGQTKTVRFPILLRIGEIF